MNKYDTYIFDFDYTLADSSQGIVMCYSHVLKTFGYPAVEADVIKRTIGMTLENAFRQMTGERDEVRIQQLKKAYELHANGMMTANTFLFPETCEVLEALHKQGAKVGIVSTKYRYRIEEFLQLVQCEAFVQLIVGGEDVSAHKPSPEGLLRAIKQLNPDGSTLYIGDSTIDAETAQAAGVDFCGVLNGTTTREELSAYPHVAVIDNLRPLVG